MRVFHAIALAAPLALAACAVGPDFQQPPAPEAARYTHESTADPAGQHFNRSIDIPAQWWDAFHSRPLSALVERALAQNPNLQALEAALQVAYANTDAQRGAFFPQITAGAGASANRAATAGLSAPTSNSSPYYRLFTAQAQVSYTPDLWGGTRRAVESLEAQAEAQKYQLMAARIALAGNIVNAAVLEAQLRAQIADTQAIIRLSQNLLALSQNRLALKDIARVDVLTQQTALLQAMQTLPPLEKQLAQQRDLLTALAGQYSQQEVSEKFDLSHLTLPRVVPLSLPAHLVRQRPDVLAAEANMHAASAAIGVAVANRLPNISLTGMIGTSTTSFAHLFNPGSIAWTLGANVAQTVFDGGTLLSKQRAAEAFYQQSEAQYRATVIAAFQNVADCLRALQTDARAYSAAAAAESSARQAFGIVQKQVKLGAASNLAIINAQQAVLQASLARIQAQAARLADTSALIVALGGGWWNEDAQLRPVR